VLTSDDRVANGFGMIAAVSLRLLYLIFQKMLGLVLLASRASAVRTSSSSCCDMRLRCFVAPTHDHA
jgi:hypothetical protein